MQVNCASFVQESKLLNYTSKSCILQRNAKTSKILKNIQKYSKVAKSAERPIRERVFP